MQVRLLGPIEVHDASGRATAIPGPKLRGLLALLALEAGSTVSSQRLIDTVWPEQETPAPSALQVTVSKLRRALAEAGAPDRIVSRPPGYQLHVEPHDVDALRFETLIGRARQQQPRWEAAAQLLEEALGLWAGAPLGGAPDTPALTAERARLEELHRTAAEDLVEAHLALGHHEAAVAELEALVADEPLRERRWGLLMRALYLSSRQADALRAYQRARDVLVDEVGVEPGTELRQLHDAVLAQDDAALGATGHGPATREGPAARDGAPVAGAFRRRGNVRHPVDACIGRDQELGALQSLLAEHRLVTVAGPGGVGKTRLAVEVSVTRGDTYPDGVWWVDLASAHTGSDALTAVQRSLGLEGGTEGGGALEVVCEVMHERSALIVLDNCEHIVAELAPAAAELLARCGGLTLLTTSREPLQIPGERVFALEPLAPEAAAQLFEARLPEPVADGAETAAAVAAICERLDRLPLALELAAARARHLRLEEILDRLENRLELLQDGPRTAPSHQSSLRSVASWSYGLLEEPEQVVFERLSVFADGATLAAARAVCAGPGVQPGEVEGHLHRLVDKSLVVADRSGPVTRFRMLQTLADFGAERLEARGDHAATLRAHARWVRDLAGTVAWGAPNNGPTVAAVQREDAAIRDAVAWGLHAEPLLTLETCNDLAAYWFGAMRVSTGWELLLAALDAAGEEDLPLRASALAWALVFATLVQDLERADQLAEEAWRLEEPQGDAARLGRLCWARALAASYRPDGEVGRWVAEAREHLTGAEHAIALGHVWFADGAGRLVDGDLDGAASSLGQAVDVFREEDDHLGLVLAISRLGELAWRLGQLDLFASLHAEMLELGRSSGTSGVVTGATARLALARLRQGDVETAQQMARSALAATGDSFMPVINGYAFRTAGLVDLHTGHLEDGRHELEMAAEAFAQGAGTVGVGQAALCWVDLSQSHLSTGEHHQALRAAETADALAATAGDPWIREQTKANLAAVRPTAP